MAVHTSRAQLQSARTGWQRLSSYLSRHGALYVMIVPGLILLALFHYYPMYGLVAAFQNYNPGLGFTRSPWVGLQNFELLFALPSFRQIFVNTLIIAVGKLLSVQFVAVIIALLLNEVRAAAFKRTVQTLIYLPHFLSWIILGGILLDLLAAQGLVSRAMSALGLKPILFLGDNAWFRATLILTNLWKEVGWTTIIYLATLVAIDPDLYEATAIDGANRWQQTIHITWPGIRPIVILVAALSLGNVLNAGFEQVLTLYNPAVYETGDILDTYVYRAGLISAQYSLAAAIGLVGSVISFLLIVLAYRLAYRFAGYRIF